MVENKKRKSSRDAPARDLAQKIRCTLKNKDPLIAAKDNVEPSKASPRSGHCDLA